MIIRKEFELDDQKVEKGVWFNMDTGLPVYSSPEVEKLTAKGIPLVRVRPLGNINKEYRQRLRELMRPLRQARRRGAKDADEQVEEKITEAAAWDVICETRNIDLDVDVPLENTPESRIEAMTKWPDLREEWLGYGAELHSFRIQEAVDGAGN